MTFKILLLLVYLVFIFGLAHKARRKTEETGDYLPTGQAMSPWALAVSYGTAFVGTSAVIGFGGAAGLFGFPLLWLSVLNILVGVFIAMIVFGKRTRRMGLALDAHTFPELLGRRYQSRFVQGFAGLVIFFFIPIYAAAVLIGACRMIETSAMEILVQNFGLPADPALSSMVFEVAVFGFSFIVALYVISGGLRAVMYTDAFQGTLMLVIMIFLLFFTYAKLGGPGEAHRTLAGLAEYVPAHFQKSGMIGWTQGLRPGSPLWMIVYTTLIYGVGLGVLAQPQLAVRFMRVKSDRELNRAVLYGGVFVLVMTGTAFVVGALSNAVFFKEFGMIPVSGLVAGLKDALGLYVQKTDSGLVTPAISLVMGRGNADAVIPTYVEKIMPDWFAVLFLLGMLAAAVSTLTAQYHVGGISLGRDFYEMSLSRKGGREITVTRIGVALTIVFTLLWGYALPTGVVAVATAFFFGLCAAVFLPAYFLGLYWKGMTRAGAVWSMIGGFAVSFFFLLFVHGKEASAVKLCRFFSGQDTLVAGTSWQILEVVDPNLIALPVSLILGLVISLITAKPPQEHVELCWKNI